ncbi:unnamed protein product [Boreogadus saida]
MRHLTTYERKASEAPEKKREEGSEALKQDLWIAILLDRIGSRREDNRSDATEHVLKIMVVHDASEEDPVDVSIILEGREQLLDEHQSRPGHGLGEASGTRSGEA